MLLIDPLLRGVHRKATSMIGHEGRVLDIACGIGSLSLHIARKSGKVTGIDLDEEKIRFAQKRSLKKNLQNAEFKAMDARDLSVFGEKSFDTAITSMAIHQFPMELSISVLKEMGRIADRIIVIDYNYPLPYSPGGVLAKWIERMAGNEHYTNFREYQKAGGINALISMSGINGSKHSYLPQESVFTITGVSSIQE